MSEFLVEAYLSRIATAGDPTLVQAVSRAADELTREGTPVRFLQTIFVPDEETCFYLYQSNSAEAVRESARRAGLRFESVTEAFLNGDGKPNERSQR